MFHSREPNPTVSTIIIEPVGGGCNLNCTYCYHSNIRESKLKVMTPEILKNLIKQTLQINRGQVKFLWHGGEPMLAGQEFYETAVNLQHCYRVSEHQRISNHFQTNATLIDSKWATFFKEHDFKVSTSLDGPEWLHDVCRKNGNGKGSFRETVEGINILERFGMKVGIVTTVNRYNVEFPDAVYEALLKLGIKSFELNIVSETVDRPSLSPPDSETIRFLTRIFDLWFKADDPTIYIRIFHNAIRSLVGLPTKDYSFSYNRCREYVACDEQGDLYTCGRFLKEKGTYLGSCKTDSLVQILSEECTRILYDRVAKIKDECLECRWLTACGGGCAYQRWLNGGFGSSFPQCEIRRALFEHIERRIKPFLS